jgi:hypothetical protein
MRPFSRGISAGKHISGTIFKGWEKASFRSPWQRTQAGLITGRIAGGLEPPSVEMWHQAHWSGVNRCDPLTVALAVWASVQQIRHIIAILNFKMPIPSPNNGFHSRIAIGC